MKKFEIEWKGSIDNETDLEGYEWHFQKGWEKIRLSWQEEWEYEVINNWYHLDGI